MPMIEDESAEQLKKDFKRLADDVAELRAHMMQQGRTSLEHLREDAQQRLAAAKAQAENKAKELDRYVHEKPWMAAGIAAAVGAALGALLAGKSRRWRD